MNVQLTPDQQAFIREGMESGRYLQEEDALRDALSMWEKRERRRAEILAAVDEADASISRGEGRIIRTREDLSQLGEDVKRRGLARLTFERKEVD